MALAALKGDKTTNEVASAYEVHPTLVNEWKRQLLANASEAFAAGRAAAAAALDAEALQKPLFEKIGRLEMELDWLKKN